MAITKNTVLVNNGNTGWTRSNVLDALEEAFADLNWNSGSQQNGVVTCALAPNSGVPVGHSFLQTAFANCGGSSVTNNTTYTHNYQVTDTGTEFQFNRFYYGSSGVEYNPSDGDYINIGNHGLTTGTGLRYTTSGASGGAGHGNYISSSITQNDVTVYISVRDVDDVYLHLTQQDAINGTNKLDLQNLSSGHWFYTDTFDGIEPLFQHDYLQLFVYGTDLTRPLYIEDDGGSGAYDPLRTIDTGNYHNPNSWKGFPSSQGLQTAGQFISWHTKGWGQGTFNITSTDASYRYPFTLSPRSHNSNNIYTSTDYPHWDYTVPADGTRSALNLRIYRDDTSGNIETIEVLNLNSSGWSDNDVFTIPGDQIGGATPANDIVFGVNTPETSSSANNGICSVVTANFGSGVNSYLKLPTTNRLMVRLENDGTKTYGTTYWLFELMNDYQIQFSSGVNPNFRNFHTKSSQYEYLGRWGGVQSLDWSSTEGNYLGTNNSNTKSFASSSTPTAYPLKIVTYKAQSPQDTNFVVFQFIQTVNGDDLPYLTFFLHKGTGFGQQIWNLDYVWQGSLTFIENKFNNTLSLMTWPAQRYAVDESVGSYSGTAREAMYGYYRQPTNTTVDGLGITFGSNLYRDNSIGTDTYYTTYKETVNYYRDNQKDKAVFSTWQVSTTSNKNKNDFINEYEIGSQADYYRPIKGLPLSAEVAPVPYYLPDDFVMIPFNITPGQAAIYPGDTVTISPSEVYEVVSRSYYNDQTTYDGITSNSTAGILFCARKV
jgi:hypothetical protein